ncbi:MAG: glycerol-3-phosphate 1-O-acyltransferase PlsY [Gammaproteobacteria bacterium]|nr:glycerol-3-phosphate 1-O-acyltransferase PlsY [Gammaproteobacteria bacterium]MDH4313749.1 glycerol-3-phosphate 1-O-acyltransferase PlsY [Gammaproteobacteria bacterium]MDH5213469.1 glycerol-3-phosphate 1-O-acyltransferase PlsY [Gammaproteobacteria bacterium]MDH5500249.1 glycerol-3-phosphate 1-O-acyltransferase PlsY [Gammaproteobacteria bacterium]
MAQAVLELGTKFLLSYFIGSLMGALIVGRIRGGIDIRNLGSGNAGGTNALRTQGIVFAIAVVLIDVGKGAFSTAVIPGLDLPFVGIDPEVSRVWLVLACAAAAVMGHVWPIWHKFRGGKGAATLLGTLAVLAPGVILPVLLVWASVFVLSGYVGLATMIGGLAAPVYLAVLRLPADQPLFLYCLAMAAYLVFSHRSNIARMRAGTEFRNTRQMVFRRRSETEDDVESRR